MTINELHIQLDLRPENKINVLEDVARKCNEGYLFVDSSNGQCYLFNEDGNEVNIKKLTTIDNELFYDSNIESIVIPDSVERIENWAFGFCENLTSIEIPNSVKWIGGDVFAFCENLTSIVIPDSVKHIGNYAFEDCTNLTSIVIPDSVESIGNCAFNNCEKLKSLIFKKLKSLSFKGKTIHQIKAIKNYPFGIKDESIIRCI